MFNFNFLDELPIKFFSSNREIGLNNEKLTKVDRLSVKNQYGKIEFTGIIDLTNLSLKESIKIKKNEVKFSDEFINLNKNSTETENTITVSLFKADILSFSSKESLSQFIESNNVYNT